MTLARIWDLDKKKKTEHLGPVEGGVFFCHRDYNDFCIEIFDLDVSYADIKHLCKIGTVWMQNAERPDKNPWEEIKALPKFQSVDASTYDSVGMAVYPYLPEFYFVPNGEKGKRFLRKSERRSERRTWLRWKNSQ